MKKASPGALLAQGCLFSASFHISRTHPILRAARAHSALVFSHAMPKRMQDLRAVSDTDLLQQILLDAQQERRSGLAVIHQLREVARRRLDARLGYPSLHRYCMEALGYSSGSAWRRIQAM